VLRCAAVRLGLLALTGIGLAVFLRVTAPDVPAAVIVQAVLFVVVQGMALLGQAALQGLQWYTVLAVSSLSTLAALPLVPGRDLAGLLAMLWVGYLASCLVMTGFLVARLGWGPAAVPDGGIPEGEHDVGELVRFSLVASAAALFMQLADNAPLLLLRDAYAPAVYGALGLAFNLAVYPSRVNALTDAFLLPRLSTALHHERPARAAGIFLGSVEAVQLAGPLLLVPVILAIGPVVRWFFAPELQAAVLPAAILVAANLPRMLMPVSKAVLFAHGHPGRFVTVTAMKLVADVVTVMLLAGRRPEVLAAAMVASWVVYSNVLDVGARAELGLGPEIDWPTLASVTVVVGALVVGAERWLLVPLWLAALVLTLRRGRRLAAMVA
jgi:O-antigen/teichoic acid export membrane protein